MIDTRWHAPALIRISAVLHALALALLAVAPAHWRWALGTVIANHLLSLRWDYGHAASG